MVTLPPRTDNIISFSDDDLKSLDYPHSNILVPTMQISNYEVGRVFIDPGTRMNFIFKSTLQRIDIPRSEIVPCNAALVRYDGNRSIATEIISLTIFTQPYNLIVH